MEISGPRGRKLSFLMVTSDKYPPFRVDSTVLFGKEMVSRGHSVEWILQSDEPCEVAYQTKWSGCNVWIGKTDLGTTRISRLRKHLYSILHQLRLFHLARKNNYDFVQVKNKYLIGLFAALGKKLYRGKFIFWLSYPHAEECLLKVKEGVARYPVFYLIKGISLKFILYKIIMPISDHIFVQSEQMKNDVIAMGISAKKITPVPMGVSINQFEPYRRNTIEGKPPVESSIVYLGTLQRARKMDFMLRVLKIVLKEDPNAILYFVGDGDGGEDRKYLEEYAENLGVRNSLIITGFLPQAEAMEYVKQGTVCVSPFYPTPVLNSTSPTKLVEYMAMEKAVVANDHPEQRKIIEQSKAGICVPYLEDAFAEAILSLMRDPYKRIEMGKHGRRYVEDHRDYKKIADVLEVKYYQLLDEVSI